MTSNGLTRSDFELVACLKLKCHPAVTAFVQSLPDSETHEEDVAWWREQKNRGRNNRGTDFTKYYRCNVSTRVL
eukprot:SAG11_NODE_2336_length_3502_cov_6.183368_2_plen_74_part_00